jgi:hypothetical protein
MALWLNYSIANDDVYLVLTARWKLTAGGAVIHTDVWRLDLTDKAVVDGGPAAVAARITQKVKERGRQIDNGVSIYQGVQAELSAPQNTDVQVIS